MTLLLYAATAALALLAWHRWVTPLSRRAAIILILLPLPFAGPALLLDRVYGGYDMLFLSQPWSDYAADYGINLPHNWYLLDQVLALAPWQHQVREALAQHQWPLWNPAMNSGDILAAGMQAAPYNPLNVIALLLPVDLAATFTAAMLFFLAGLCAYGFARELGCSDAAALVGAVGFAYSSGVVFWIGWTPLEAWVLLPFVLLAVRRMSYPLLTTSLTLLILFGHPETMLHVVAIGAAYGVFQLVGRRPADTGRCTLIAIAAGVTALALTAIFLLPFVAVLDQTWQYEVFREQAKHPAPVVWAEVWRAVGATFIPYYGGASWYNLTRQWDFGIARVGSVVLALAAVAAARLWRQREVRFFFVLALIALIAAWNAPPVVTILRKLPLFAVAKNERLGFAAAFALSMLAAMAFDARAARARVVAVATGAILLLATAALWRARLGFGVETKVMLAGAAAELLGIAMLAWAWSRRAALAVILAAIAVQRFVEDGGIYPYLRRQLFYPSTPLIGAIPRDPLHRVVGTANLLIPNAATMYGLEDVRGYASVTFAPYKQTTALWCPTAQRSYHDVTDLTLPFLSFLGVRHAITPRDLEPPPGWRVVADDRKTRLMENPAALPRVFIPRTMRFIDNDEIALTEMEAATDFASEAWIHTAEATPQIVDNGQAALHVQRVGARYEIDVDAHSGTRVVITDVAWPGWRAYLDGRRVKMERANLAFLSVYVPEGRHHLRVVYLPDAFVRGRAISLTTLLLLVTFTIRRRIKR